MCRTRSSRIDRTGSPALTLTSRDRPTEHEAGRLQAVDLVLDGVLVGTHGDCEVGERLLTRSQQQAREDERLGLRTKQRQHRHRSAPAPPCLRYHDGPSPMNNAVVQNVSLHCTVDPDCEDSDALE